MLARTRERLRVPTLTWAVRFLVIGLLSWIALSTWDAIRAGVQKGEAESEALYRDGPTGGWDLKDRLANTGALPQVVLSDPDTSYLLPYLIGSYVVTMPASHGSPYIDHVGPETEVREFFLPHEPQKRLYEILERYGADAVALAPGSTWPSKGESAALIRRLRHTPGFVYSGCCGTVEFFRYAPPSGISQRGDLPSTSSPSAAGERPPSKVEK